MRVGAIRPISMSVERPERSDPARLPSVPRQLDDQFHATQLESRLRKQYQCQQAKKAVCNAISFGVGVACAKTFGALGAAGFLAAHVATVKEVQRRLVKDVTVEKSTAESDDE